MKCPTCNGSGEVPDEKDPDEFCGEELILWTEDRPTFSGWEQDKDLLSCILKNRDHPEGYHEDFTSPPCPLCWGIDMHTSWCPNPDIQVITSLGKDGAKYRWDDTGAYWVIPRMVPR